ncbi:MAG: hypothetical protein LQ340_005135 [Diploschistes diacapsis]|nr:MAG: hypothetical protein LQ340_005135 [Diploschistes diacapsis]
MASVTTSRLVLTALVPTALVPTSPALTSLVLSSLASIALVLSSLTSNTLVLSSFANRVNAGAAGMLSTISPPDQTVLFVPPASGGSESSQDPSSGVAAPAAGFHGHFHPGPLHVGFDYGTYQLAN